MKTGDCLQTQTSEADLDIEHVDPFGILGISPISRPSQPERYNKLYPTKLHGRSQHLRTQSLGLMRFSKFEPTTPPPKTPLPRLPPEAAFSMAESPSPASSNSCCSNGGDSNGDGDGDGNGVPGCTAGPTTHMSDAGTSNTNTLQIWQASQSYIDITPDEREDQLITAEILLLPHASDAPTHLVQNQIPDGRPAPSSTARVMEWTTRLHTDTTRVNLRLSMPPPPMREKLARFPSDGAISASTIDLLTPGGPECFKQSSDKESWSHFREKLKYVQS